MKQNLPIKNKTVLIILDNIEKAAKRILGHKLFKIFLYGSYSRNENEKYSDLDILLLIDDTDENINKYDKELSEEVFRLSLKHNIYLSIILKNKGQFYKYSDVLPFYMNILREGIEIYG